MIPEYISGPQKRPRIVSEKLQKKCSWRSILNNLMTRASNSARGCNDFESFVVFITMVDGCGFHGST